MIASMDEGPHDVTILLRSWAAGEDQARDRLIPLVYDALRQQARQALSRERTLALTTTGLVHQLYIKLTRYRSPDWNDRRHFLSFCSRIMRQIITDEARALRSQKRGSGAEPLMLSEEIAWVGERPDDYFDLNTALDVLKTDYPDQARVVELRFYLGCTAEEAADATGLSKATVDRHFGFARAWLYRRLREPAV